VRIVITSAQRETLPFALLVQRFSPDIAARIVGTTPVHEICDAGDAAGIRYSEILAYLGDSGTNRLALDDDALLFPPGCAQLVLCEDGFGDAEERALRTALEKLESQEIPISCLRKYIVELAKRHGVAYTKPPSDGDAEMNDVELLLIALERAGVVPSPRFVILKRNYMDKKTPKKKSEPASVVFILSSDKRTSSLPTFVTRTSLKELLDTKSSDTSESTHFPPTKKPES